LGEAQLKRSSRSKGFSDEELNKDSIESEEFEALCSQPLSLSQSKKSRIEADQGTVMEPLVGANCFSSSEFFKLWEIDRSEFLFLLSIDYIFSLFVECVRWPPTCMFIFDM